MAKKSLRDVVLNGKFYNLTYRNVIARETDENRELSEREIIRELRYAFECNQTWIFNGSEGKEDIAIRRRENATIKRLFARKGIEMKPWNADDVDKQIKKRATQTYVYYQPNEKDKKNNACDCVIRAICKATGQDWKTVFKKLANISLDIQAMPNEKKCYEKYLKNEGFVWVGYKPQGGTKRPTVKEFSKLYKGECAILRAAHHLVCIGNGSYYDSWDSGDCSIYGYWEKRM